MEKLKEWVSETSCLLCILFVVCIVQCSDSLDITMQVFYIMPHQQTANQSLFDFFSTLLFFFNILYSIKGTTYCQEGWKHEDFSNPEKNNEDSMAGLQSKFQNLNAKVNQMWTTDAPTSSIHKP